MGLRGARPHPTAFRIASRIAIGRDLTGQLWFNLLKNAQGVEKGGHADSHWSYIQQAPGEKAACPRVYFTMPSGSEATGMSKTKYVGGEVIFTIEQPLETCRCSACGSENVIGRGKNHRRFRAVPIGGKPVYLELAIPRVECRECNVVRQVEIGFADPRVTYTKAFARYALELSQCMTIQDVADHLRISWDVIKEIQKADLKRRFDRPKLKHLRHIAIDEISTGQGACLPDARPGPGQRSGGPCRLGKRRGCPEGLLEASSPLGGQDRGRGHGHVAGLHRRGHNPSARCPTWCSIAFM